MLLSTPPLGWNSWNTFGENINETVVMESADTMVRTGLRDAGYEYIVIDDCWLLRERDSEGRLVPDPEKFPHGMKYVSDYVHSKGLKFGMYSCAGFLTCAGYPASFDHEFTDARTFAEWGVDYLKYDYCFHPDSIPGHILYKRMAVALANCGRDIAFSACSWGSDETKLWIKETGANLWRTTGDINDSWKSLKELSLIAVDALRYGAINCYPDMDMLICGMNGNGNVGLAGCTEDEYRLHFSLWALLGSPLMIGCDIRSMDETTASILTNKAVLAINQDPDYNQPFEINIHTATLPQHDQEQQLSSGEIPIYAKLLSNGDYAIGIFNLSDTPTNRWSAVIMADRLGLPETSGMTLELTDVWTGEKTVMTNGIYSASVAPHACKLMRARVIPKP
ncbi:MAG: glycoside hydrolase family 27 protein [Lachnospiraceae bacterium]|nr:glycoside hydrolase family 27 protein [Lachnospiraceae bacterium]